MEIQVPVYSNITLYPSDREDFYRGLTNPMADVRKELESLLAVPHDASDADKDARVEAIVTITQAIKDYIDSYGQGVPFYALIGNSPALDARLAIRLDQQHIAIYWGEQFFK